MVVRQNFEARNHDKNRVNHFFWHLSRYILSGTFVLLGVVLLASTEREALGIRSVIIIFATISVLIGYFWLSSRVMRLVPEVHLNIIVWLRMTIVAVMLSVLWLLGDCSKPNMGLHEIFGNILYFMRCTIIGHDAGLQ